MNKLIKLSGAVAISGAVIYISQAAWKHFCRRNQCSSRSQESNYCFSEAIFFPDKSLDRNATTIEQGLNYKIVLGDSRPLARLLSHFQNAKETIDVCLFLITSHQVR